MFEAEYPYLIDKARVIIGNQLYDDLSKLVGVSLEQNKDLYSQLWQVYAKFEETTTAGLAAHEIQLKQFRKADY